VKHRRSRRPLQALVATAPKRVSNLALRSFAVGVTAPGSSLDAEEVNAVSWSHPLNVVETVVRPMVAMGDHNGRCGDVAEVASYIRGSVRIRGDIDVLHCGLERFDGLRHRRDCWRRVYGISWLKRETVRYTAAIALVRSAIEALLGLLLGPQRSRDAQQLGARGPGPLRANVTPLGGNEGWVSAWGAVSVQRQSVSALAVSGSTRRTSGL
jgi:hypothetical protein